jgi:hypothetical protein
MQVDYYESKELIAENTTVNLNLEKIKPVFGNRA